ncbi:hypothetical protein JZU56_05080, partial [bacterium]|nr:hypothetical protein [bacterium]
LFCLDFLKLGSISPSPLPSRQRALPVAGKTLRGRAFPSSVGNGVYRLGFVFSRLVGFRWDKEAACRGGGLFRLFLFLRFFVAAQLTFGHDVSPRTIVHSKILGCPCELAAGTSRGLSEPNSLR